MGTAKPAKKRQAQDATLINTRAVRKQMARIEQLVELLADRVYRLEHPQLAEELEPPAVPAGDATDAA